MPQQGQILEALQRLLVISALLWKVLALHPQAVPPVVLSCRALLRCSTSIHMLLTCTWKALGLRLPLGVAQTTQLLA